MTKITIKPVKGQYKTSAVFHDGVLYATYRFDRARNVVNHGNGRRIMTPMTAGSVTYADGRKQDIGYYAWAADVARDFRNGAL